MSDWQPIETAPKDGTRLLAYWPGFGVSLIHRHNPGGEHRNPRHHYECWVRDDNMPLGGEPTHWMPLPGPPRTDDVRRQKENDALLRDCAAKDACIAELEDLGAQFAAMREALVPFAAIKTTPAPLTGVSSPIYGYVDPQKLHAVCESARAALQQIKESP